MTEAAPHGSPPAPPGSILLVCIRLIGDVILSTPLIGLLKSEWPNAEIDMLVNRGTGEFLEKDPRVRRVLYATNRETMEGAHSGERNYVRDILRKYDLAVNLNASDRGTIAVLLAGTKVRVGFFSGGSAWKDSWKKRFLTHPLPFHFSIHVARNCELAAKTLGIPVPRLAAKVFWDSADEAKVDGLMRDRGVTTPFFVVHPFARWKYKYWKTERFAETSDAIANRHGLAPVWTSSPDGEEMRLLREGAALCRCPPAVFAGSFTLNQMTCLLSRASLYLGLDTAVSHLAATTGVPMVVLFGPTIAERWSPWNNDGPVAQQCPRPRGIQRTGNILLVQKDWDCVPCGKAGCDDRGGESRCMTEIEVAEVIRAVEELLGAPRPGASR
jgi:heptosyltransferase-3